MFDLSHFLEQIKIPLIVVGVIVLIVIVILLYLLIARVDERRRTDHLNKNREDKKEPK